MFEWKTLVLLWLSMSYIGVMGLIVLVFGFMFLIERIPNRRRSRYRSLLRRYDDRIAQWKRENWWRYPPPEGWQEGFTCDLTDMPPAFVQWVERGETTRKPSLKEILYAVGAPDADIAELLRLRPYA